MPLLLIALFLSGWQVLASTRILNPALFPAPTKILNELVALHTKELPVRSVLFTHTWITVQRTFIAAGLGIIAGILTGVLMGVSQPLYRFCDPLITLLMPIPGIAMAPLFIIWLGFGNPTIITLGIIATFFPVVYNTAAGVRSMDKQLVRAARIMGAHPLEILFTIYLPWAAGHTLTGVKLGLARCWRTIIAVEFVAAASWGLGYMIWNAAEYLRAGVVYGGIGLLIVLYFLLEQLVLVPLEKHTVEKWGMIKT